jgi:hypothetical protein
MKQIAFVLAIFATLYSATLVQAQTARERFTMIFSARPPALKPFSIGGHAFVTWGLATDDSLVNTVETAGFYPTDMKAHQFMSNVRGKIKRGYDYNRNGNPDVAEVRVDVPDSVYFATLRAIHNWQDADYNLCQQNCLSFLDEMADHAGLKTPSTKRFFFFPKTPHRYVKQLHRKNTRRAKLLKGNWQMGKRKRVGKGRV